MNAHAPAGTVLAEPLGPVEFPGDDPSRPAHRNKIFVDWDPDHPYIPKGWEDIVNQLRPHGNLTIAWQQPVHHIALSQVVSSFDGVQLCIATDSAGLVAFTTGTDGLQSTQDLEPNMLYRLQPGTHVIFQHALVRGEVRQMIVAKRKL